MKNFSDLLAINLGIDIELVSATGTVYVRWPLLVNIDIACAQIEQVIIDGMDVTKFGHQQGGYWRLQLDQPFYRWRHMVTGQGWLLEPTIDDN